MDRGRTAGSTLHDESKSVQSCKAPHLDCRVLLQVIGEEFAYGASHSRGFRALLFLATMAGFTLVALLQLIHDGD